MDLASRFQSQYFAALEMMRQLVTQCPPDLWDRASDRNAFWQLAYHALFYTHFYLHPGENAFQPWLKHRPAIHRMESRENPYSQADLLEFIDVCQGEVVRQLSALDPEADSGFDWLPFDKFELQIYNLRHLQQHVGELSERLGCERQIEIDWVGLGGKR